ncbi:MAG TPA: SH3 domain-containing protein [Leptolinea sp.]
MTTKIYRCFIFAGGLFCLLTLMLGIQKTPVEASGFPQNSTILIATVTGTPMGAAITVKTDQEHINVRSGPGTIYPNIGSLLGGLVVPAKGRSPGGEWILVDYPGVEGGVGWVYAPLVDLIPGSVLPIIEPPPTPTPLITPTINPTLAAQFIVTSVPTRLPTFTPPAPLVIPTFQSVDTGTVTAGVPPGLIIISLITVGSLIGAVSFTQRR